ncbi:hypothetical protein D6D02_05198 [Aureobasidium pullulans]|uniref:Uncharacterized protein n=2 Tax=Aureobasidium pullulans TaxID=5580 RepID=A0A074XP32_AURPU|nr:uncharacterized protein M438DRAFT_374757 [Aureobasidium pullulans EXF-150]THW05096.1 hypothetical protein D6D26_02360 [Aureobasidium pullulans]KEQ83727.1 hypothetical protein M438DRAFT_374757 [Aureobasidium pullulans EXF-150]THW22633.1 hypothetical protein D6D23_05968 [Aureobasidium pullulans]THW62684.1 hypothetical protein D6D20_04177 [Aureobasidium pullulans]THY12424.1 hypothetical protein D6D02_05198 [Aureobasidium pullulans]
MFQTLMRRAAAAPKFDFARNPYKSKRTWPPDFTKLSQKHQFRLERRYRRRAKLKWARPTWTKFVKLSTWATISFVVVYGVLFMETDERGTVFDTIRDYYARATKDMFGTPRREPPTKPRATSEEQSV